MRLLQSLVMKAAECTSVPAGRALAVDRTAFSSHIEAKLGDEKLIRIVREEVCEIPADCQVIVASGPLTSSGLAGGIQLKTGKDYIS